MKKKSSGSIAAFQHSKGFLMSLEAAFALTLLLFAATALPAFSQPKNTAPDFFLCSDATLLLVKSGAFTDGSLQAKINEMHSLSGMCFSVHDLAGDISAKDCDSSSAKEKTAITVPVWSSGIPHGFVQKAAVYCWRDNYSRAGK
jgi:hypothetical protein